MKTFLQFIREEVEPMSRDEYNSHVEKFDSTPKNTCVACHKNASEETGGNGYFCHHCFSRVQAMVKKEGDARQAELAAKRSKSGQQAASTRKAKADGTYEAPYARPKNMARYREVRSALAKSRPS